MRIPFFAVALSLLASAAIISVASAADRPPLAKAPFSAEQGQAIQQQWASHIDRPVVHANSIGVKLSLIPPGEFTMGRTEEQFDELMQVVDNDPQMKKNRAGIITWSMLMMPAHRVRITRPFYLGTTESLSASSGNSQR